MASYKQNLPPSALIKQQVNVADKKSKAEVQRDRQLEEDRKAGTAPAMVDVQTGRDINPHIPMFISQNPWYVPSEGPTLKHQRPHEEREKKMTQIHEWYQKGTTGKSATKFRKGACENCGAMGHQKRDCFDRPRKSNAKETNDNIAEDDYVQPNLTLGFDAKRDRWNGYDPSTHKQVIEDYEHLEEARKVVREHEMKEGEVEPATTEDGAPKDEDMYAEDADMAGVSVDMDSRTRITVRNLRIREDTAKYLYNLAENSPYYDPKSRSMRENPFAGVAGKELEAARFSGDNFVRYSGEVTAANEAQVFAWQATRGGVYAHSIAEPTKLEALKKEYEKEKSTLKNETQKELLDKYGGGEHMERPADELLLAQTESYIEYNRKGKVIKGKEKVAISSRFKEDIYPQNHTSVFGSFWREGRWGYKCCHQFVKNSYCTGKQGIEAETSAAKGTTTSNEEIFKVPKLVEKTEVKEEKEKEDSIKDEVAEENSDNDNDEEKEKVSEKSISPSPPSDDEEKEKEREKERLIEKERRERDQRRRDKKREKRERKKAKLGKRKRRHRDSDDESGRRTMTTESSQTTDPYQHPQQRAEPHQPTQRIAAEPEPRVFCGLPIGGAVGILGSILMICQIFGLLYPSPFVLYVFEISIGSAMMFVLSTGAKRRKIAYITAYMLYLSMYTFWVFFLILGAVIACIYLSDNNDNICNPDNQKDVTTAKGCVPKMTTGELEMVIISCFFLTVSIIVALVQMRYMMILYNFLRRNAYRLPQHQASNYNVQYIVPTPMSPSGMPPPPRYTAYAPPMSSQTAPPIPTKQQPVDSESSTTSASTRSGSFVSTPILTVANSEPTGADNSAFTNDEDPTRPRATSRPPAYSDVVEPGHITVRSDVLQ